VCHLEDALGLSQPKVSRYLGILRLTGVVQHRREGSWVYYALARQADQDCEQQLSTLVKTFGKRAVLQQDLETTSCSSARATRLAASWRNRS
jgi:DNA-binding transcriptional ArsR family regulator